MIFGIAVVAGLYYRHELTAIGEEFVAALGGVGLLICYFSMDAFLLPIPQDPFATLALTGGMDFWHITLWAGTGSILGGCLAFFLGRKLCQTQFFQKRFKRHIPRGEAFMAKWGVGAVLVAGMTPFPYSVICWVGGTMKMRFWPFFWASLAVRYVRVASYLWVIERGLGA